MDEKYLLQWLESKSPQPTYNKFKHNPLVEHPEVRSQIMENLARHIFIYHRNPDEYRHELVRRMRALRYSEAADVISDLPKSKSLRSGGFGEVLACEYLRQTLGFAVPVYRLRYRQHSQVSPPGEDLIAIRIDSDSGNREVFIGEAKAYAQFKNSVVETAYAQLEKVKPRPESLSFILQVLADQENWDLHDQVIDISDPYCTNPFARRFFILLVTGNTPQDPFAYIAAKDSVLQNLIVADLVIADLPEFVAELFDSAPTFFAEVSDE